MSKKTFYTTKQRFYTPFLLLSLGILVLSSSCSITKRHYRSGYLIEWSHHKKAALKPQSKIYSYTQANKSTKYLNKEEGYNVQEQTRQQVVRNVSGMKREKVNHKRKLAAKMPLHISTVAAQNQTTFRLLAPLRMNVKENKTFNFGVASLIFLLLFWLLVLAALSFQFASYVLLFFLVLLFYTLILLGPVYAIIGLFHKKPASCRTFSVIALLLWILSITLLILLF